MKRYLDLYVHQREPITPDGKRPPSIRAILLRGFLSAVLVGGIFVLCSQAASDVVSWARAGERTAINPELTNPEKASQKPLEEDTITPTERRQEADARVAIDQGNRDGLQRVPDVARVQTKAFFSYSPTAIYEIFCHEGHLTDIQLQPGEEILFIGGGDTVRWLVDKAQSGSGDQKQWHIYVKPLKDNLVTNFMITTDRRSYQVRARAANFYNPIIGWSYPLDEKAAFLRQQAERKKKDDEEITPGVSPEKMNFSYKVVEKTGLFGSSYTWTPKLVFDDGSKTYIQMADTMPSGEAPALFVKNGSEVTLVNYRVKNSYYIVDRLFLQAEMRNGLKETVVIKRNY